MRRPGAWPAAGLVFVVGCGGLARLGASDGGASSDAWLDAGSSIDAGAPGFVCPSALPSSGDSCGSTRGEICEYGPSPYFVCNATASCRADDDGGRTWRVDGWTDSGVCARQVAVCADAAALVEGSACPVTPQESSEECDLPGQTCSCSASNPWSCQAVVPPCPGERPRLGSPCDDSTPAGMACDYGDLPLACDDGNWIVRPNP